MKNTLFFLLLFFLSLNVYSQNGWTAFELFAGHHQSAFLNPTFSQNYGSGSISKDHEISYEVGLRLTYPYILAEASYFRSHYKTSNLGVPFENNKLLFDGLQGSLSVFLLPQISEYFSPYAGLGYASGSIRLETPEIKGTATVKTQSATTISSTPISSALWKFGFRASYKRFTLNAEYRQSLGKQDQAFQQFNFTLGFKMMNYQY